MEANAQENAPKMEKVQCDGLAKDCPSVQQMTERASTCVVAFDESENEKRKELTEEKDEKDETEILRIVHCIGESRSS